MLRLEPRGAHSKLWTYASPVLAMALTVVTSAIIFSVLGKDPLESLYVFLVAPLVSSSGLPELFVKAAPLILIGVGLSLGFRANVWNIGAEGQYTLGAIFAGGLALGYPDAPAILLIPGMIVLTAGWCRMKRSAMSGSVVPAGTSGFSASARSTLAARFSGTK